MAAILLTGARGYLGVCLQQALTAAGHQVTALQQRLENLQPQELAACTTVVHCAGALRHRPDDFERSNVLGTERLLQALRPDCRLLLISSRAVYSPGPGPLHEDDPCATADAYGQSKYAAEQRVRASGLPCQILRPGLLFGPAVNGELGLSFLSQALQRLSKGLPVRVYTPDQRHDSLFVQDAAVWISACLALPFTGQVLNLAGSARSLHQTLSDFATALQAEPGLLHFEPGPPARMPLMDLQRLAQQLPARLQHSDAAVARLLLDFQR